MDLFASYFLMGACAGQVDATSVNIWTVWETVYIALGCLEDKGCTDVAFLGVEYNIVQVFKGDKI